MSKAADTARRMFDLTEPIGMIPYSADEPTEELFALGLRNYWDTYFAGRAAPLGRVPAEVVHAVFYNFAPGEAARHLPRVWDVVTPDAAMAARDAGAVKALRRILGDLADSPGLPRAADVLLRAATSAPTEGRPLYAALLALPLPEEALPRLWRAATLLREHRGEGHIAALMSESIGGTECHVLVALDLGLPAEKFGRIHHLSPAQLTAVVDGLRRRGLVDDDGRFTTAGRATKDRIEALTDELAAAPYRVLDADELEQLADDLTPIAAALTAASER